MMQDKYLDSKWFLGSSFVEALIHLTKFSLSKNLPKDVLCVTWNNGHVHNKSNGCDVQLQAEIFNIQNLHTCSFTMNEWINKMIVEVCVCTEGEHNSKIK